MPLNPDAANPSRTDSGNNLGLHLVIGISGAVALVLVIVVILVCRLWKYKQGNVDYAEPTIRRSDIVDCENGYEEPTQKARPDSREQPKRKPPPIPDFESMYEEPKQYEQLDSSKRVAIDENYQGLKMCME